jgi:hypothetical protein
MNHVQVLSQEYQDHPWITGWRSKVANIDFFDDWQQISNQQIVVCGADVTQLHVKTWLNQGQPAVYVGRGYCGNHIFKHRKWWRASVNGWANTVLKPVPHSRWSLLNLPYHDWKVCKVKKVLIAPSSTATSAWEGLDSQTWSKNLLNKFPGAEVKIRFKDSKPALRYATLWDDLDWCDLVVTQSSAVSCEAFWYGKKVISLQPCPTWAAGRATLDDWQNPTEPADRESWHEHLAWSQYSVDEWASGEAFDLLQQYLGPIKLYDSQHCYNLPVW